MGLLSRLRKVGTAAVRAQLSGDTKAETDLDALAAAELEAELADPPPVARAVVTQPKPAAPVEAPSVEPEVPSAPVVRGPGGKRSL